METPKQFLVLVLLFEAIILALYATTTEYPKLAESNIEKYPIYQDVHVMIFIGFGFLMTFLRRYGFSALTYNFMIASFCIQWGGYLLHLFGNFWDQTKDDIPVKLDLDYLIDGDIAAATVLISFGAVIGRTTPVQLLVMAFLELPLYALNFVLVTQTLHVKDVGGSIVVHSFGAYFGLGVSYILGKPKDSTDNKSIYHSDIFAMIGTLFLWIYWPSFNGYFAEGNGLTLAVVNTVLSLTGSVMSCLATSLYFGGTTFDMVHIQNSTLAGGVAVGTTADQDIKPVSAIAIGIFAGFLSVWGYRILSPILCKAQIFDSIGVHNLHGTPGVLAGLVSIIVYLSFDNNTQARDQFLSLIVSLGIATFGGLLCGCILSKMSPKGDFSWFHDEEYFEIPHITTKDFFSTTVRGSMFRSQKSMHGQAAFGGKSHTTNGIENEKDKKNDKKKMKLIKNLMKIIFQYK